MAVKHICIFGLENQRTGERVTFEMGLAFSFYKITQTATNRETKYYKLTFALS
jgi:hypothetical protein